MEATNAVSYFKKIEGILGLLTILNLTAYKWPKSACPNDGDKFDFIIVGGGTAGCLIANRLLEAGNVSVLLIEAGGVPPMESEMAGLFPYLQNTKYDWNFTTTSNGIATKNHKDNVIHMSQGKMLGGSGSSNYLSYVRGNPHDYNKWAAITKDISWSWECVLPIFCKNEKLIDNNILNSSEKHYYGTEGEIQIKKQYYSRNSDFFHAFEEMGYGYYKDINQDHPIGVTSLMHNIADDIRQSTALKFLSPIKNNPNLHVLLNTLATKIIFNHKKTAVGVEVLTASNSKMIFKARKEIIVTAGTIKSPQLLMLSGIGPKDHLENRYIKVISDLPVGKKFRDHLNSIVVYKMTNSPRASKLEDPHKYPYGILDAYLALNKSQGYPDFEVIVAHFGDNLTFTGLCAFYFNYDDKLCDTLSKGLDNKQGVLAFITYFNPKSKGEILLTSKNPNVYPLIIPGYYSKDIDIENHAKYLAEFNRILDTKFFKSVSAEFVDPQLEECEGLTIGTKEYWRCHAVGTSDTAHYFVGTCAMGKVVDSRLRVHGVKNLRVADASIMPTNIRALTQATVIMIAQKASDMIIKDWGLK